MAWPFTAAENEITFAAAERGLRARDVPPLLAAEGFKRTPAAIVATQAFRDGAAAYRERLEAEARAEAERPQRRPLPFPVIRLPDYPTVSLPWISGQAEWAAEHAISPTPQATGA